MSSSFQSTFIAYSETGKFSKIVSDYIDRPQNLENFFEHPVSIDGVKASIRQREKFDTNRLLLVEQLKAQYKNLREGDLVKANIDSLSLENTFTVCTAHQPNIFTGHLYFIYKIIHTIKVAAELKKQLPQYNFIPVFFMGSEDADLEELNHLEVDGKKYTWETKQSGAVGRMKVDEHLLKLIDEIEGRLSVEKYGKEIIDLLRTCFQKNDTVEQSTFLLVHDLFKSYGLVVFLPDNGALKKVMLPVFEEDIFKNVVSEIVNKSSEKLSEKYKVQAHPREINLFYLRDNIRNRIVQSKDGFEVHGTKLFFTKEELENELKNYPDRFSPNVILRGVYQEIILPNIAFIGGGGEIAYWLELKNLFAFYKVPYPILLVRNSFMIVGKKYLGLIQKLSLASMDLFKGEEPILNDKVVRESKLRLALETEKSEMLKVYASVKNAVKVIDSTLEQHTEALETQSLKRLSALEKKMFRAEKRKFADQRNQLSKIFSVLFPGGNLQERTENFMLYYAIWGRNFFEIVNDHSLSLEQKFCILEETTKPGSATTDI